MKKTQHSNALLMEILIAVLIFGLASTVVLNLFGAAYRMSSRTGDAIEALAEAQSLADRLYLSCDPETLLTGDGFICAEDGWTLSRERYDIAVSLETTDANAGTWHDMRVLVKDGSGTIVELPCSRYISGEAAR